MEWSSEPWVVIMCLMMSFGAFVVFNVGWKMIQQRRLPKDMADARPDLEHAVRRVINANMELMEAVRECVETMKRLPPEYQIVAHQVLKLAMLMEEATYEEGAREGLFPRPLFTAGGSPPALGKPIGPPPPSHIRSVGAEVVPMSQRSSFINVGGQLLRTG